MTPPHTPHDGQTTDLKENVMLTVSVLITAAMLVWLFRLSHYGIDLTDESLHLIWMAHPFRYEESTSQYGFMYHSIYVLLAGDIAALRQINILVTFALAWALCWVVLRTTFGAQGSGKARFVALAASLATVSLLFLNSWVPTPSYYSLTLQSLLIAATGLLLCEKKTSASSIAGWLLLGVGGWLAFMAKPTTAAALAACAVVYLLAAAKLNFRLLAIAAATSAALLCLSAWAIDGSIAGFIDRLRGGVEAARLLGGGHTLTELLRIDRFTLALKAKLLFLVTLTLAVSAACLGQAKNKWLAGAGIVATMLLAALSLVVIFRAFPGRLYAGKFQELLILAVPVSSVVIAGVLLRLKGLRRLDRAHIALALVFLMLPHAYAFGTNGNYWIIGAHAGLFWILGGIAILGPLGSSAGLHAILVPLALAGQLVTVALINTGITTPYRQPEPLWRNGYVAEFGNSGQRLVLSNDFGRYIDVAVKTAMAAGFKKDTPVIDLTGQSPGILYAMGADNIGQAWMIGGYPGSDALAEASLKKVPCTKLARAWLLLEEDGPRHISSDVLRIYNADLSKDFEVASSFQTAPGVGGYETPPRLQKVLKPIRSFEAANTACAARKSEHS